MEKQWIDENRVMALFPKRERNAHKGDFGHVLIVAGKQGMTGAALLCTGAALRSGCGLVTVHLPASERLAVHIAHPSAIVSPDCGTCFSCLPENMDRYSAVGAGPGLGQAPETVSALRGLLETGLPAVLDADALNIIAGNPALFSLIPKGSVLTPHIGELKRLLKSASEASAADVRCDGTGSEDGLATESNIRALAVATGAVIVVKGWHTAVFSPSGSIWYNTTGNPGMASGGSGDVLTGLVAGLLARGFSPEDAACAGVWLHGRAGDMAAAEKGEESMNASDILSCLRI